jgi:hypothetical protein
MDEVIILEGLEFLEDSIEDGSKNCFPRERSSSQVDNNVS